MKYFTRFPFALALVLGAASSLTAQTVRVELTYHAPVDGQPKPNFSPKGMQVPLTPVTESALPPGASGTAKAGVMKLGVDSASWIGVLATTDAQHPRDLTQLYIDRNRNGSFADDGPPLAGVPAQNDKTKAWWTSINKVEVTVPYAGGALEPYLVNFWIVRDDSAGTPELLRYSVSSWRSGTAKIGGVDALVAMMDDNDAIFSRNDMWSALAAADSDAAKRVLSIGEARATTRLMFVNAPGGKEIPLEFKSVTPDGRWLELSVVNQPLTKAADRAPDDNLREERSRPRTATPVAWGHGRADFSKALAAAKTSGKMILLDFEATWCGPCHTMDQWIWNDAEVAAAINAGFIGVKIDVDIEKQLVSRFRTTGYPTMILLDPSGREVRRVADYMSSKQMLEFLATKK